MKNGKILALLLLVSPLAWASGRELSNEQINTAKREATASRNVLADRLPQETQRHVQRVFSRTKTAGSLEQKLCNQTYRNFGWNRPAPLSGGPFAPDSITGLQFWYRDDSIVSSGGFVSQWTDKSGNGIHLLQNSAISKPEVDPAAIGGHDAIIGDGSNDYLLSTATFTLARPYHIFGVMKCAYDGTAYAFMMIGDGTSKLLAYNYTDGATLTYEWDTSSHSLVAASPPANDTWFYFEMLGKAGANATTLRINNGTATTTTFTADPTAGTPISLFARTDGSNASASEITEIFCYSEEKTGADRTNIITYLQSRYGL